jgi:hypothetical protein
LKAGYFGVGLFIVGISVFVLIVGYLIAATPGCTTTARVGESTEILGALLLGLGLASGIHGARKAGPPLRRRSKVFIVLSPVAGFVLALYAVALLLFPPGLYTGITPSPEVYVTGVSCSTSTLACSATLGNSGSVDAAFTSCEMFYGGSSSLGKLGGPGANDVPSGGQATSITCSISGSPPPAPTMGSSVTGAFYMKEDCGVGGGPVAFSGIWS